ncbi:unnamed protein product [Caenorhabditis bovis]|uniref:aralkylamine N-acetyltransferase n=1 Tax=Caenorhabditis bovis TaxID=2654633 RepID=A0A8S1FAH5_9PELO|nr:unnamed protein product [Caenorhabditis bovis]
MATWKYGLQTLTRQHRQEALEFLMNNFRKDEPLSRAASITCSEIETCFNSVLDRCLLHPLSVVARCKETNKLVGCMLNSVWRKEDALKEAQKKAAEEDFKFSSERLPVRTLGEILNELHDSFWSLKPEHDVVLHFEIASVNQNFRRQGMASQFLKWTEDIDRLKSVNASGILAEATSLANQTLLSRKGYETLATTMLNMKCDTNGEQILKCDDGTDRVLLMFKEFKY